VPADLGSPPAVARALVGNALALRRGEHLVVATWNHTLPWASAAVAEARRVGARPILLLEDEGAFWRSTELAPHRSTWTRVPSSVHAALRRADALLIFPGPADRPRFRELPHAVDSPFLGRDDRWLALVRSTGVRGVRCLLGLASDVQAESWRVPGAMWRSQLIRGITEADYEALGATARRVARVLAGGREVHLTADGGTDLRFRLLGRTPWVDDGRIDAGDRRRGRSLATAPPGSVVVAIDERSTTGTANASRPSFLSGGRAEGAQWEIDGGRLRNYWYTEGGEAFETDFAAAPRGRETVSLFALGLNESLAPAVPQAEDLEAGTVTLAIGGNSLYGGRNRCRYLSWITIGKATIAVDGEPFCDRGKIL
jgi:leucyl aminopeptidase (aminopeptidase T)